MGWPTSGAKSLNIADGSGQKRAMVPPTLPLQAHALHGNTEPTHERKVSGNLRAGAFNIEGNNLSELQSVSTSSRPPDSALEAECELPKLDDLLAQLDAVEDMDEV